ncbi:MAG: aminotransferase, partial [Eggerthellaceae bacterium]|nr:aminotransferase [Eggerthellaceae bacterium]
MDLSDYKASEIKKLRAELEEHYACYRSMGLKLNMSRGKPSAAQLDLSMPMLNILPSTGSYKADDGTDCRNYGILDGIPEAKKLMGLLLEEDPQNVIVCGNSSLNIMYDFIARIWIHGTLGMTPWGKLDEVKWICPVPGYDRHFAITESFGMKLIPVALNEDGPDMDVVEKLVADESVKGIWCVPQYSNPGGEVYSDEVVARLA